VISEHDARSPTLEPSTHVETDERAEPGWILAPERQLRWGEGARLLGALVIVSVGAAAFAMAFRSGLQFVYRTLLGGGDVLDAFTALPIVARLLVPALGGLLAGGVARLGARTQGQGVGEVMEAVVLGGVRLSVRATGWKALGSWFAIGTGNSIGREGPLIQFGGGLGCAVAGVVGITGRRARALIAAGTAAGFAAAYNTPLAAVLFVVEVIAGVVAVEALMMVMVATAISTVLVRASVGGGPIYGQRAFSIATPTELVAHALLGVVAAFCAQAFMRMLAVGERLFERSRVPQPWRAGLGGLLVGAMATILPHVTGNGYEPLNRLLDEEYTLRLVALLVVAKAVATTASVSSGSPGGVFTPSLFIGGGLGFLWGHVVMSVLGTAGAVGSYALVGMAAVIAATTHAPLMASVLVFELSGDYAIVLPLVLATAIATAVSSQLRPDSIYAAELTRRGVAWRMTREGRRLPERGME
jgi:chloride channel protein, CIC family